MDHVHGGHEITPLIRKVLKSHFTKNVILILNAHSPQMPVFSLGNTTTCDTDLLVHESLFDPSCDPPTPSTPPPEVMLAAREEFAGVWFSYEYFDTGPAHPAEVCNEVFIVGVVDFVVTPDLLHRIRHFKKAYRESVEACPLFSEG